MPASDGLTGASGVDAESIPDRPTASAKSWRSSPGAGIIARREIHPFVVHRRRAGLMSSSVAEIANPVEETEAYETLLGRVAKRTGKITPEDLVRHVLSIVPAGEWPVRVEAMDALLRRIEASKEDKLRVESRPPEGRILGLWGTRRPGSGSRPYRTVIMGVSPIQTAVRLPRLPEELAGRLQTWADRAGAYPRAAPAVAAGDQGAGVGRAAGPGGAVVGPDPAADRTRRLAGARLVAGRDRGRRRPIGPRRAGPAVVPGHGGRGRDAQERVCQRRQASAGGRRRPDQGHPGRRVGTPP